MRRAVEGLVGEYGPLGAAAIVGGATFVVVFEGLFALAFFLSR